MTFFAGQTVLGQRPLAPEIVIPPERSSHNQSPQHQIRLAFDWSNASSLHSTKLDWLSTISSMTLFQDDGSQRRLTSFSTKTLVGLATRSASDEFGEATFVSTSGTMLMKPWSPISRFEWRCRISTITSFKCTSPNYIIKKSVVYMIKYLQILSSLQACST